MVKLKPEIGKVVLGADAFFREWGAATSPAREFYVRSAVEECAAKKLMTQEVAKLYPVTQRVLELLWQFYQERPECHRLKLSFAFGLCFARAVQAEGAGYLATDKHG